MAADPSPSPDERFIERHRFYHAIITANPEILNNNSFPKRDVYDPELSRLEDAILAHRRRLGWANYAQPTRVVLDIMYVTIESFSSEKEVISHPRIVATQQQLFKKYRDQLIELNRDDESLVSHALLFSPQNTPYIERNIIRAVESQQSIRRLMYVHFVEIMNRVHKPLEHLSPDTPDLETKKQLYVSFYQKLYREDLHLMCKQESTLNRMRRKEADLHFQLGLIDKATYNSMFGQIISLRVWLSMNPDMDLKNVLIDRLNYPINKPLKSLYNQIYKLHVKAKIPLDEYMLSTEETLLLESGLLSVRSFIGIKPEYTPREESVTGPVIEALDATQIYRDPDGGYIQLIENGIVRHYAQSEETITIRTNNPYVIDAFIRYEYPEAL